ncbi:MAG: double zinc ribbon domain-containing protein, partial [Thermoanaerobaculum sp.]
MGSVVESLVQALLPARCLLCRDSLPVASGGGVCSPCWQALPRLPEPACERCG